MQLFPCNDNIHKQAGDCHRTTRSLCPRWLEGAQETFNAEPWTRTQHFLEYCLHSGRGSFSPSPTQSPLFLSSDLLLSTHSLIQKRASAAETQSWMSLHTCVPTCTCVSAPADTAAGSQGPGPCSSQQAGTLRHPGRPTGSRISHTEAGTGQVFAESVSGQQ